MLVLFEGVRISGQGHVQDHEELEDGDRVRHECQITLCDLWHVLFCLVCARCFAFSLMGIYLQCRQCITSGVHSSFVVRHSFNCLSLNNARRP